MTMTKTWTRDGYTLRAAAHADAELYYAQNYLPLDPEVAYLTGSRAQFFHAEVVDYFHRAVDAEDCCFFLLIAPDGRIAGENVINEIDRETHCANFRIAIFHAEDRGKGLGCWMVEAARDFAFDTLGLRRLELDVYSFNPRAKHIYTRAGFKQVESRQAEANAADEILMVITADEWKMLKA